MDDTPLRPSRIVTVLGMHRSGTSAFTRILDLLGATLGHPDALIPPAPDNPRGFWENRPLVLVNDRILALHGGSWAAPPDLSAGWHERPTMRALHAAAGEVFDRLVTGPDEVVAWKDPRSCLLQDFWQPLLAQRTEDLRHLHVVRSPDAVVGSLVRRNDLTPEHAARLWVRYVTEALRAAPDALVLDQSILHSDLELAVTTVADAVGLAPPSGRTWDAIVDFVDQVCSEAATITRLTDRGSGALDVCTKVFGPVLAQPTSSRTSELRPAPCPCPPDPDAGRSLAPMGSQPRSSARPSSKHVALPPSRKPASRPRTHWSPTDGPSSSSLLQPW